MAKAGRFAGARCGAPAEAPLFPGEESPANGRNPPQGRYPPLLVQEQPLELRPLDLAGIFDQTFDLYRANFWLCASIAAAVLLPLSILGVMALFTQDDVLMGLASVLSLAMAGLLTPLVCGAITYAIASRMQGTPCTMASSFKALRPIMLPLVVTMLLGKLLVFLGSMFCVVPGILFYFWTLFFAPIIVLERRFYFEALQRNRHLMDNPEWVRTLGVITLLFCLLYTLEAAPSYGLLLFAGTPTRLAPHLAQVLLTIWSGLSQTLIEPLKYIAIVVLYHDVRVRTEALDLQLLAARIGLSVTTSLSTVIPWGHCRACGYTVYGGEWFCRSCGAPLGAVPQAAPCSRCHADSRAGDVFCRGCGAPLGEPASTTVAPLPPGLQEAPPVAPLPPGLQEAPPVAPLPPGQQEAPPVAPQPPGLQEAPPVAPQPPGLQEAPPVAPLPPGLQEAPPAGPSSPDLCPVCKRRVADAALYCAHCGHTLAR